MTRLRPPGAPAALDALVAALATLAVTLPLAALFTPTGAWLRPSVLLVGLVALTGVGLRAVAASRPVVVLGQALVLAESVALLFGQGHLWRGLLPVPETGKALGIVLVEAYRTVTTFSAPAPADRGTVLAISVLVAVTAVTVDALAVTYRSPALAGVPLLTAFLAGATNTSAGLSGWLVIPPAACWLAMVGRQGVRSLHSWGGTAASGPAPEDDPAGAFATLGRVVGALALAAAVLVPGLLPHLPPTFLAEGLARGTGGDGAGSAVRLSTSIDIARDLGSRSTDPVLVYRSTDPDPEPLRVGLLDTYSHGRWSSSSDRAFVPLDGRLPGAQAAPEVPRTTERIDVRSTLVGPPQVALPPNAEGSPFPAGTWRVTGDGLVELTTPVQQYSVEYTKLAPDAASFGRTVGDLGRQREYLELDPGSEAEIRALLRRVAGDAATPLETAVAIQDHLRGPQYTYSEELADETADGRAPEEPLSRFLQTRRGYCVQFSSAMVMLSRAAGIPARMAVGFLPGVVDGQDRVVRADDAHAWPELYFPDVGWTRFEPTPGVRSGLAPPYSRAAGAPGSDGLPGPTASASASPTTRTRPQDDVTAQAPQQAAGGSGDGLADVVGRAVPTVLGVLAVLLLAAATPVGARLSRRSARRRARDDAERVEAEWGSLLLRLSDIGLAPGEGATPRQASHQLTRAAYLTPEEGAALGRVVDTLERARYARPGAGLPDVAGDAHTVWRAALGRRRRRDQARALLLPEEGRRHWRALRRRPDR